MWKTDGRPYVRPFSSLAVLGAILLVLPASFADEPVAWVDSTRDLYVDGRLDRNAQLFLAEDAVQSAVLSDLLPEVMVFDRESLDIGTLDKKDFDLSADRTLASSPGLSTLDAEGEALRVDSRSLLFRFHQHTVLVAPHQGHAGEIPLDELWSTVPVWRARSASYDPAPEIVSALADVQRDVDLTLVFGTWCGDSKHYIPELLKAIDLADNSRLGLQLISIRRGFEDPLEFVRDHRIINVPTVIVTENTREIGRIVETPALESFEADLAAILAGQPPVHAGRWKRERRLSRGTYHYLDGDSRIGVEEWEIFAGPDDTTLVHSRLQTGERTTEIWHRRDADGVTNFVEITRQDGVNLSRSRFWIEEGHLQSVTRGNATGIVEQTMELPPGWTILLPSAVDVGGPVDDLSSPALRLTPAGAPTSGRLYLREFSTDGREEISTPAGRFNADRVIRRVDGAASVWWLHPELGLPVQGELDDGVRVVLAELEQFADAEPGP